MREEDSSLSSSSCIRLLSLSLLLLYLFIILNDDHSLLSLRPLFSLFWKREEDTLTHLPLPFPLLSFSHPSLPFFSFCLRSMSIEREREGETYSVFLPDSLLFLSYLHLSHSLFQIWLFNRQLQEGNHQEIRTSIICSRYSLPPLSSLIFSSSVADNRKFISRKDFIPIPIL